VACIHSELVGTDNEDYEFRRATLNRRDGDWYLHTSMLKEDDDTDLRLGTEQSSVWTSV